MNEWFFAKNGQQNGPVSHEELRQLAQSGKLDAKDLVWNSSMKDWVPAGQVDSLFAGPAAAPADPANPYAPPQSSPTHPSSDRITLDEITPGSEPIDAGACVKRGFELTKRHFGNILLVGLVYIGIMIAVTVGLLICSKGLPKLEDLQQADNAPPANAPVNN